MFVSDRVVRHVNASIHLIPHNTTHHTTRRAPTPRATQPPRTPHSVGRHPAIAPHAHTAMQLQRTTRPQCSSQRLKGPQPAPFTSSSTARAPPRAQARVVVARAAGADDDAGLEERLAALRRAKGATPDKEGSKAKRRAGISDDDESSSSSSSSKGSAASKAAKKAYDFSNETVHWEGGPAAGDLVFNIALGATLVALPLTVGAIARAAFVKFRFTDKRVSVVTTAPWENKQTDCAYQEVRDVRVVSRGLGAWGDMVIELNNGDKLELRSVQNFKELRDYVLSRRDALGGGPPRGDRGSSSKVPSIMDLDMDDAEAMKRNGKGFA